ncbi:MAG: thioredoxin-disulfide reductase [Finegoldia sp.]|nr:thioredoxin-disulfide reductase [Finegoldia sp.]
MYDLIIIGAGPAGLSAAIYAARAKMDAVIVEEKAVGGQILNTLEIENYPGSDLEESGPSLMEKMKKQIEYFKVQVINARADEVYLNESIKKIRLSTGETLEAKSIIVATGASPRKLNCKGEQEFTGRGVSYCATCDADFFNGLEVIVVGGGNTAVEEAIYLTRFAKKVTVLVRADKLRADRLAEEKAREIENLHFKFNTSLAEIKGEGFVKSVILRDNKTGEESIYESEDGLLGVFVFVGTSPHTDIFKGKLELNEDGYIIADKDMKTDISGVFAAGDVRNTNLRQVVTAVSDGAIAAVQAQKYIDSLALE